MSLLPLYDEVISQMDGNETVLSQTHCSTIARLNQENLNIIFLLILHHASQNGKNKSELPYGARTISNGKGISYRRLNQVPDDLQKIIYRYLMLITQ